MTTSQLSNSYSNLLNQDTYFHNIVKNSNAITNNYNTTIKIIMFNSNTDYQTYTDAIYNIDTNNKNIYLENNPTASKNQPRFITYKTK